MRSGIRLDRYLHGAGHETGRRAGTENVPYIAALGKAAELAGERLAEEPARICALRDRFHHLLEERAGEVLLNGHSAERLPNTLNVSFAGVAGAELLVRTPEVAASTGSACHDGTGELSGVLKAMGTSWAQGFGAVRFSLGRLTTEEESTGRRRSLRSGYGRFAWGGNNTDVKSYPSEPTVPISGQ